MNSPTGSATAAIADADLALMLLRRIGALSLTDDALKARVPAVGVLRRTALITPRTANIRLPKSTARLVVREWTASRRTTSPRSSNDAIEASWQRLPGGEFFFSSAFEKRDLTSGQHHSSSAMPPRKKPPTPGSAGKGRQLGLFESFQRDTPSKRRRKSAGGDIHLEYSKSR